MKRFVYFFIPLLLLGCKGRDLQVKYFSEDDGVKTTRVEIVDIPIDNSYKFARLFELDSLLLIVDVFGEKGVHVYDKRTFGYLTSTAIVGKGPNEVTQQGRLSIDKFNKCFWLSDNGKKLYWKFPIDSVLSNVNYKPTVSLSYSDTCLMDRYGFINKEVAIGMAVKAVLPGQVEYYTAIFNTATNTTRPYGYEKSELKGKETTSFFGLSTQSQIYVLPHAKCDLMTICNIDGTLRYNVYGQDWGKSNKDKSYFGEVVVSSGKIIVSYLNDYSLVRDKHERVRANIPTKLLVFDIDGNHSATIETGNEICSFCIDEDNHRVICYFNGRENPLGYFNFDFEKELKN